MTKQATPSTCDETKQNSAETQHRSPVVNSLAAVFAAFNSAMLDYMMSFAGLDAKTDIAQQAAKFGAKARAFSAKHNLEGHAKDGISQARSFAEAATRLDAKKMGEEAAEVAAKAKAFSDAHNLDARAKGTVARARTLAEKHHIEEKVFAAAAAAKDLDVKRNGGKVTEAYGQLKSFVNLLNNTERRKEFGRAGIALLNTYTSQHAPTAASKTAQAAA